jgi:prepilin-type N-terminal cleavage/methylation domain-containing protein
MRGFTLIEVVVYLALFSVLMTGCIVSLYTVAQGSAEREEAAAVAQEATFVEQKINWAIVSGQGTSAFALNGTAIMMNGLPLTSANVRVSDLKFVLLPHGVEADFVMNNESFIVRSYPP